MKKVLVVDDDPDMTALLRVLLEKQDYEVETAIDGVECMASVRKHDPDVVILDLGLPAGDGFKQLERLKKKPSTAEKPVIVLSARAASEAESPALKAGACAYLEKPVCPEALYAALESAVG